MTYTAVTGDVCLQEGTFAFDFDASGMVKAGQGVYAAGTMSAKAPSGTSYTQNGCIGVAMYTQNDQKPVAILGPSNIARIRVSGANTAVGDVLRLTSDGYFTEGGTKSQKAHCSGVVGIALETQATHTGICRVLLF